ncbi:hypothetical protein DPEC_G00299000 [Dallia pectoralis]|uniref:Uncharacterized protein n=1 Tax=Dallia pectoralis TaxID=75939 RepID=A0ACC2FG69_DALPE|nr:hypothetical protein DPEC_G00299000 [Dallia pectoralis]
MAATDACAAAVQEDSTATTENKTEVETTNSETVTKTDIEIVSSPPEEAQPPEEASQSTEQPADAKAKQASDNMFSSFLNKSGLGKVMGGRKKKEPGMEAEEAKGEGHVEPKKASDQADEPATNGTEAAAEDQAIEKVPEHDEVASEEKPPASKDAKPKHGEKSSVKELIRKPVARIFSHRSTEKKDGGEEPENQVKIRSRSLDRLEDAEALNTTVDQPEDSPAAEESEKPASVAAVKHMKRWHSFKKLMAQKSHKKSSDESKECEGADGASGGTPGDTGTLDSKNSENSGQKRWKLKRSWTFQGMKRDPSVVGISKAAKGEKEEGEENATENDEAAVAESDEAKVDGEAQEETNTEVEEEKGAAAAAAAPHKSMNQHADEIWTSFKKRVIHKSKRSADTAAAGGEEETAAVADPTEAVEQTDELGKEQAKTAKAKRTHFNRAVSLKNFIMRKGKSTSVDQGEGAPKECEEGADGETKDMAGADAPAGTSEGQQEEAECAQEMSHDNGEAQVVNDHTSANGEASATNTLSGAEPEKVNSAEPAAPAEPAASVELAASAEPAAPVEPAEPIAEVKTNGENGCSNGTPEENAVHSHETTPEQDGPTDEAKQENTNSLKDAKILNLGSGNAVAQSEIKAGNV